MACDPGAILVAKYLLLHSPLALPPIEPPHAPPAPPPSTPAMPVLKGLRGGGAGGDSASRVPFPQT